MLWKLLNDKLHFWNVVGNRWCPQWFFRSWTTLHLVQVLTVQYIQTLHFVHWPLQCFSMAIKGIIRNLMRNIFIYSHIWLVSKNQKYWFLVVRLCYAKDKISNWTNDKVYKNERVTVMNIGALTGPGGPLLALTGVSGQLGGVSVILYFSEPEISFWVITNTI